ncbi:M50 family metallopeptidase [Allorhizocola rhizosphaerae]|uniref:M50 family metallopeptidase n=1 Tax=Allorhizocola rhizosphaerae TaxID=1872709 RepID=UPI000E3E7503|nr:site-2 protease family protein [Allorhizocola rhizosphaerae]
MAYILGLIAGALGILISVSLHEAGHMGTAKAFGMKVTRYFVGFGPTLWSFRRGETEYGVKGIPLGGFVKIVGMTPQDEDASDEKAMWRHPVWKRTIVLAAGSIVHFILAFLIFWGVAATSAMANPALNFEDPYIRVIDCVQPADLQKGCTASDPAGPAKAAGLQTGDKVLAVGSTPITKYMDMVSVIRALPAGQPTPFTVLRDGQQVVVQVSPTTVERPVDGKLVKVSAIGVSLGHDPAYPATVEYNAFEAIPVAGDLMGTVFKGVLTSIKKFPEKIPGLWTAITGGERDPESPLSVVGASRLSGELVEAEEYPSFWMIAGSLNMFVGLFNLLPLLPLDGGHIAIAWFEKVRSWIYARLRKPDPGRVDYYKLMPLTYTVILIFGAFTLLTVTADIVNPITIFR